MLIDSHAHLDMPDFDNDREKVLERALEGGVCQIITIGIDLSSSLKALELAKRHDFIYATVGYHPHHAKDAQGQDLEELKRLASDPKVVAWGEIGLDFYRRYSPHDVQSNLFRRQLDMAADCDLPVIIHDREAHMEIMKILKEKNHRKGVIHCFSGDYDLAMEFIKMGYYISIPGTVTYKKALQVHDVASRIPLDNLLLETDAPFLSPDPFRGKRNEPYFVTYTAQKVAELRGMPLDDLARHTSKNARHLFQIPLS